MPAAEPLEKRTSRDPDTCQDDAHRPSHTPTSAGDGRRSGRPHDPPGFVSRTLRFPWAPSLARVRSPPGRGGGPGVDLEQGRGLLAGHPEDEVVVIGAVGQGVGLVARERPHPGKGLRRDPEGLFVLPLPGEGHREAGRGGDGDQPLTVPDHGPERLGGGLVVTGPILGEAEVHPAPAEDVRVFHEVIGRTVRGRSRGRLPRA